MSDKLREPCGFFWRTKYFYCCVILHRDRKIKEGRRKVTFCKEYQAVSPQELVKKCREEDAEGIGYEIGSPKKVKVLCDSAPRSPKEWMPLPAAPAEVAEGAGEPLPQELKHRIVSALRAAPSLTIPEEMPEWFINVLAPEIDREGCYEPQTIWKALSSKLREHAEREGKAPKC